MGKLGVQILLWLLGGISMLTTRDVVAIPPYNMPQGVSEISHTVYNLHMLILWICVVIGVLVFGVMLYSVVKHRKSVGYPAAQFHDSVTVEIVWTVVPFLILVLMAIPATKTLIAMEDTSDPDLTIKITGYQWRWKYDYLDQKIEFFSTLATPRDQIFDVAAKGDHYLLEVDNELVVPIKKKIRLLITAGDVLHAWWIPELALKKDAIPGFINEMWTVIEEPGVYRGQCAELCGRDHGFMPVVVRAVGQPEFDAWVAERGGVAAQAAATSGPAPQVPATSPDKAMNKADLMAEGQKVYNTFCASCHQANGAGLPGTFPALTGAPVVTGPKEAHIQLVLHGKPGTAMVPFGEQLNDAQLAAVITYQRNALGNNMRDVVQPNDVKALRQF